MENMTKAINILIGRRGIINLDLVTTNNIFELYSLNRKVLFDINLYQTKGNIFITCSFITT